MPKKGTKSISEEIEYEKWFKVQCLARNKEYLKLFDEWSSLDKDLSRFRARHPQLRPREREFVQRVRTERFPHWNPIPEDEMPFLHLYLSEKLLQEIKGRLAELPGPARARLSIWIEEALFKRGADLDRKVESRMQEIQTRVRKRFGLSILADPRPYRDAPPDKIEWFQDLFLDSIRIMAPTADPFLRTTQIDLDYWKSDPPLKVDWDEMFRPYIGEGRYLFLVLDVRHTRARLRHDFDRIVGRIERLKRSGRLASVPKRPGRSDWDLMLQVCDMKQDGNGPSEIARELWPKAYHEDKVTARKRAHYSLKQAEKWISMEWARLG